MKIKLFDLFRTYRRDTVAILIIVLSVIAVFQWVPQTFFQQDEWYFIGKYYLFRTDPSVLFRVVGNIHFVPLQQLWFFIQYYFFGFNSVWYGIVSVCCHAVVAILAYTLFRMLSFRTIPTCIGVAFFALNPVSSQVVSWPLAAMHGSTSMICMLFACIIWMQALKKQSKKMSIIAGVLLFCAMLFKEDSVFGYMLIPVITYLFVPKRKMSYVPIIISFLIWFIMFISILLFGPKGHGFQIHRAIFDVVAYITFIPQWMAKIIITHDSLRAVLQRFFGHYTIYLPIIDNDPFIKTVCTVIAEICFFWYLITTISGRLSIKKVFIFPFFVVLSIVPYFFSGSSGLESRYYFIPVFITGMWIAWYLDWVKKKKYVFISRFSSLVLFGLLIIFCFANQPREDYLPSHEKRKIIVSAMQKVVKPSSETVVYYIEHADSLSFQSGIGEIFLVLQTQHDLIFSVYFTDYFLYRLYEEGYQKLGEKGFGYYSNSETLKSDINQGLFPASAVRAYSFDKDTLQFRDITNQYIESM